MSGIMIFQNMVGLQPDDARTLAHKFEFLIESTIPQVYEISITGVVFDAENGEPIFLNRPHDMKIEKNDCFVMVDDRMIRFDGGRIDKLTFVWK